MPDPTHADVPLSFFEYKASYREPVLHVQRLYSEVALAVFRSLREWNIALDGVSYRPNPANLGEVSATFTLFAGRVGFTVGLGSASLLVRDPNWSEADLIGKIAEAGMGAIVGSANVEVARQQATITMHVKPVAGRAKTFVQALIQPRDGVLTSGDVAGYGFSMYREGSTWVVDSSVLYPEALFLRIERTLSPGTAFAEMATILRHEENELLDLLRLEIT